MGCRAADAIEHYAYCKLYHEACGKLANIGPPPPELRLASFLGLASSSRDYAALRALTVHVLYAMHNASRHGGACSAERLRGFLLEAARGHSAATRLLSNAFKRPRLEA